MGTDLFKTFNLSASFRETVFKRVCVLGAYFVLFIVYRVIRQKEVALLTEH